MPASRCGWRIAVLCAAALTGCAHDGGSPAAAESRPPIVDQSMSRRQPDSPYRTVVHGDTLYSIAWEAGRDYRELAAWNRIRSPYTIRPGQQLRVLPPGPDEAESAPAQPGRPSAPAASATKPKARATHSPSAVSAKPAPPPVASTKPRSTAKAAAKPGTRGTASGPFSGSWTWPADGQIVTRYGDGDSKGLDIAGSRAAAVRAAANGRVVYRGSGLRGYGQLIIVKHSEEFLSAYAHNDRIHVKEGDVVKRGQRIADMGSTGTDRVKLHFEIRRHGVPIDPLRYLPKR